MVVMMMVVVDITRTRIRIVITTTSSWCKCWNDQKYSKFYSADAGKTPSIRQPYSAGMLFVVIP